MAITNQWINPQRTLVGEGRGRAFSDTAPVFFPCVIKDDNFYRMWYSSYDSGYEIHQTISQDSMRWTSNHIPTMYSGSAGTYVEGGSVGPYVLKDDNDVYKMWYAGIDGSSNWRIMYSHAEDGATWSGTQMVIDLGDEGTYDDGTIITSPCVIKDGSTYKMWYAATDASNVRRILYTDSNDGLTWANHEMVTNTGIEGYYDIDSLDSPIVLKEDGEYHMWYSGLGGGPLGDINNRWRILYASSSDGTTWSNHEMVVDHTGIIETYGTDSPCVINDDGTYKMYRTGISSPNIILYNEMCEDTMISGTVYSSYIYSGHPVTTRERFNVLIFDEEDNYALQRVIAAACEEGDSGANRLQYLPYQMTVSGVGKKLVVCMEDSRIESGHLEKHSPDDYWGSVLAYGDVQPLTCSGTVPEEITPPGTTISGIGSGGNRGLFFGGHSQLHSYKDDIEYITISTLDSAADFGNLSEFKWIQAAVANSTGGRAVAQAGHYPAGDAKPHNAMEYISISTLGNSSFFGELSFRWTMGSVANGSNNTGIFAGGTNYFGNILHQQFYINISTLGDAVQFGSISTRSAPGTADNGVGNKGLFVGGGDGHSILATMDIVNISTLSNGSYFGQLTIPRSGLAGVSNKTNNRAVFAGGASISTSSMYYIDYVNITISGDAADFGELTTSAENAAGCSNGVGNIGVIGSVKIARGSGGWSDSMDYINISTVGNASTWGALIDAHKEGMAGTSNA